MTRTSTCYVTSFSDCGRPVKEFFLLVLTSFNIAAGIVLLFEVGLSRLTMGCECPGVAIFMAHFDVQDVMRNHPNLVPAGYRSPERRKG